MNHTKHHPHKSAAHIPYESNPFKVIFNGFDKLFKTNQTWAIVLLVLSLFGGMFQFLQLLIPSGGNNPEPVSTTATSSPEVTAGIIAVIIGIILVVGLTVFVISLVFNVFYLGTISYVALQTAKGKTAGVGEALSAVAKKFWTILWIQIVVFFKILGGYLLLIVPGVRASLRYQFVLLPVFDGDKSAKEAIRTTKALTKDHLLETFGMLTAASIIPLVGPLLTVGGLAVMYPQLKELKASGAPKPPVHWLNYLGFILIGSILVFVLLLTALIVLLSAASNM